MLPTNTTEAENSAIIIEFYLNHKKLLYTEAWKYLTLQEDVEDIVYEALARIMGHIETFRALLPREQVQYAKAIVRNLSYIHLKRSSRFTMVPFEDVDTYLTVEENQLPESIVSKGIQLEQLRKIWAAIPVGDRLLLEQKYILKWTDQELASILGIQPQSVRMRLTRAKRRVIALLKEQGFHISDWL